VILTVILSAFALSSWA